MKTLLTALVAISVSAPTLSRAEEPLDSIPSSVGAIIRFQSVDKFVGNAKQMFTSIGGLAAVLGPQLELGITREFFELGADASGLDRTQPGFAAIFPIDRGVPVAWFVKAKDEAALRRAVARAGADAKLEEKPAAAGFKQIVGGRREAYFATKGGYTVYCVNERVVKHFADSKKSISKNIDADAIKELKAGDASLLINSGELVAKYKDEVDGAKSAVEQFINALPEEQLGPGPEETKKLYVMMAGHVFTAVYDSQWVVARTNLGADGASASASFGFKPGSMTHKVVKAMTTNAMENLEILPAASTIYFGMHMDYGGLGGDWIRASAAGAATNPKLMKKALEAMGKAKVTSTVTSVSLPSDAKTGVVSTMMEQAKDVAILRKGWGDYMAAMGEMKTPMFTQKVIVKRNAEKYKKHAIDLIETSIDTTNAPPEVQGVLDGLYKKILGGNRLQSRLVQVDNILLQVTGNDAQIVRKTIDRFDSGKGVIGLDKAFGKTRDKLDEEVVFIAMIDFPRLVSEMVNVISDVPPFNQLLAQAPFNFAQKNPASFTGVSLGKGKSSLRLKVYVPTAQPKAFMKMFAPSLAP